jgi:hypothetical protein
MRRRPDPDPGGMFIDGVWFPNKNAPECLAAQAALNERRRARRARLMARIELESGGRALSNGRG